MQQENLDPLNEQRLLTKLLEGRYNREHQSGLERELSNLRLEEENARLREQVETLRHTVAELQQPISLQDE